MKNLKMLFVVAVFAMTSVLSASTNPTKEDRPASISEQVAELLKSPTFEVKNEILAKVSLMVNDNNEFVVLNVEATDERVQNFIKSRLNYKKAQGISDKKSFEVPVRVVPAE